MRELTFELEYDEGAEPLMDVFGKHPTLTSDSIASCISRDRFWLIERFEGPSSALDRIKRIKCDDDAPNEEMTEAECGATRHSTLLERTPTTLVVHVFVERLHTCNSVFALAARHLDLGFVIQSRRRNDCHEFRLLMRSDENVDVFVDHVDSHLGDGIGLHLGRFSDVDRWNYDSLATVSMSGKQRETLRAAIEHGYYETPRGITVGELAEELDVPQSTVSYRLRQAEARLAKGYLSRLDGSFVGGTEQIT